MQAKRMALGLLLAAGLAASASVAQAQVQPGPPQGPPAPFEAKADCSEKSVKDMQGKLDQLDAIEKTAPETIEMVCDGVKMFSDWMGWKDDEPLPPVINDIAKKFIHQNLTPRMLKAMCQQAQGEAMRNFRTEIGQIKDKLAACKGI